MASSLHPNASKEEIEEEIDFQEVLIQSLDTGADDYADRLLDFQNSKFSLEQRLAALQDTSQQTSPAGRSRQTPTQAPTMNGWQQAYDGGFGGYNGHQPLPSLTAGFPQSYENTMKRPFAHSDSVYPSKRPTPEPSNVGTPTSSTSSFELVEHPGRPSNGESIERARQRQLQFEAAVRRQQQTQREDEQYARSLQRPTQPPSFGRSNVQTTLNSNGTYQQPPPPPPPRSQYPSQTYLSPPGPPTPRKIPVHSPSPYIKAEPGPSKQHQPLPQRTGRMDIIDLTNSDDDDEVTEVARSFAKNPFPDRHAHPHNQHYQTQSIGPYGRPPATQKPFKYEPPPSAYQTQHGYPMPPNLPATPQRPMPGASPSASYPSASSAGQFVYGAPGMPTSFHNPNWTQVAMNGVRNAMGMLGNPAAELNNLINGGRHGASHPGFSDESGDDSDDIVYGGSRPLQPGMRAQPGLQSYAGHEDLFRLRAEEIANYDPEKTTEEINALLENIRPDEEMPAHLRVQTPEAMSIKLHKYQELGLTWLQQCEDGSNKGGVLADDMGLGKTIQMLALLVTHKSEDPRCKTTLIVAPVALMRQWRKEIDQKLKPGHKLSVYLHHGPSKKKDFRDLRSYDVVLTTYGSLASELKKMEVHMRRKKLNPESDPRPAGPEEKCALISDEAKWYRVILDEAQCIKNSKTQTAKAACLLQAQYRFCVTGTPMMNNVDELHSLIKFLRIRPYNEWTKFRCDIAAVLKRNGDWGRDAAMQKLQALCKAVMLRRTKQSTFEGEPILRLPDRSTEVDNPEFCEDEMAFYKALEERSQLQFNRYMKAGTVGKSYSAILVLLLRLRQACCHPHLIKDFSISAAAGLSPDELADLAKELSPAVVARIESTEGNFECPVCYDAVTNPAIFVPCGHDTCRECFSKIADPSNAIRDGNEGANSAKCPTCRAPIDPKRITDFDTFRKVHMPGSLTAAEKAELDQLQAELDADSETESDDSETESEDDVDAKGNLKGFIDNGDEDDEEEAVDDVKLEHENNEASSSAPAKSKKKKKKPKMSKKAKGKKKEKEKVKTGAKTMTLAEMKKVASKSSRARRAYMARLRADWMTSAKIEKTLETLKEIMNNTDEKVLVFSQWTSLLDLLEVPIDGEEWGYRRYDGSMSAVMRNEAVEDFADARQNVRIMLVSLKAGNAGLNLNMASQVIILDPFWNPYIEEQAIDRAHRLGQTRPVKVHRMLIKETVEDRIIELQEKKRALISKALDEGDAQKISRLGVRELAFLFGVGRTVN